MVVKYLPKSRGKKISKTKTKTCHVFSGIICNKIHVFENLGYKSFFFFSCVPLGNFKELDLTLMVVESYIRHIKWALLVLELPRL